MEKLYPDVDKYEKLPREILISTLKNLETRCGRDVVNEALAHVKSGVKGHKRLIDDGVCVAEPKKKKRRKEKKSRKFDWARWGKQYVAMKIHYFGESYQGLADQESTENTVEGVLFAALQRVKLIEDKTTCGYTRCGRTDKVLFFAFFCNVFARA
jgi:hypothetical protein